MDTFAITCGFLIPFASMQDGLNVPLPERFRSVRLIGEGAMGVVYEVWDTQRNERLALKTIQRAAPADIREFKREFRTVAHLSHPNLVPLYELFYEGGTWCFTMQLIHGVSLLASANTLRPERETRALFFRLADALNTLHLFGVLHRDVKPDNVLVTAEGEPILLDFGLVTKLDEQSHASGSFVFAGSPAYMSPEQMLGKPLGPASDWYAFGVTLYQALSGTLPFATSNGSVLLSKLAGNCVALSDRGVSVSAPLELLCQRLLSSTPADRPTGDEVLETLGALQDKRAAVSVLPPASSDTVVGRETIVGAVIDWLLDAPYNIPRLAVLRGPSGIGKTTVAHAVLEALQNRANTVLIRCRCRPEEAIPFNAWDGVVDGLCEALLQRERTHGPAPTRQSLEWVFPVLASEQPGPATSDALECDPIETRHAAMRELRQLLREACQTFRLVVFIDDIQWADADSLRLLREVVTGPMPPEAIFVVTDSTGWEAERAPERSVPEALFGRSCRVFDIPPLTETDSRKLLAAAGLGDAEELERVLNGARGNPFLLGEFARWRELRQGPEVISLKRVLAHRLKLMPQEAEPLFQVVALLGHPVGLNVALEAAGAHASGVDLVHRLTASGLLRFSTRSHGTVEVYHDCWRVALQELVPAETRAERFKSLARALESHGSPNDAEVLALCYRHCGNAELSAQHFLKAARHAERSLAFERATRCYRAALELGTWSEPKRAELFGALGQASFAAGLGARAGEAFLEAANRSQGAQRVSLLRDAARALLSSGRQQEGESVLGQVLSAVGVARPGSVLTSLLRLQTERFLLQRKGLTWRPRPLDDETRTRLEALDVAASTWVQHDPIAAWVLARRQLRLALAGDDVRLLLRAVSHELILASSEVHDAAWLDSLEQLGTRLCSLVDDAATVAWFHHAKGMRLLLAGDWQDAAESLDRSVTLLRSCQRVHWELCLARHRFVAAVQIVGDMRAPERDLQDWLRDAERRDDRESVISHLFGLGYCELAKDAPEQVWAVIEKTRGLVEERHEASLGVDWLEALTLCYQGASKEQLRASLTRLRRVHRRMLGRMLLYRVWTRGYEIRVASALALTTSGLERRRVLTVLERLERSLSKERWHHALTLSHTADAAVSFLMGDARRAAALLETCAQRHSAHGALLHAAAARHASHTIVDDAEGTKGAEAEMRALHISNPLALARSYFPAFYPPRELAGSQPEVPLPVAR